MIVEKLKSIIEDLCSAEVDAEKCESGNVSAGRRLRKVSMAAIKDLKDLRMQILEHTKK
jgi:hypothetical protein